MVSRETGDKLVGKGVGGDDWGGYFWGAKENFVFFTSADDANGAVFESQTAKNTPHDFRYLCGQTIRYDMYRNYETIAPFIGAEVRMLDPNIGATTRWKKGTSGNPGGRPKSRLLSEALRARLAEIVDGDPTGRTFAECIADNMIQIACSEGPGAVHAASEIADRIEERSRQQIEVADFTADLRNRSDAELQFYLDNNRWPTDEEKALLSAPVSAPTT